MSFPFLYLTLDLPKTIVNEAIGGEGPASTRFPDPDMPFGFGRKDRARAGRPSFLVLCFIFLGLVV